MGYSTRRIVTTQGQLIYPYSSNNKREYRAIEIKDEAVDASVVEQISYYVNWASQNSGRHLDGAFNWNIQPIIVAPQANPRTWPAVVKAFKNYNKQQISLPILYFEFQIKCGKFISFYRVEYEDLSFFGDS